MEKTWLDIRYGIRMLAKRPGFAGLIVLSLALGIGANTAIFSAVNAVMLKTLPVRSPEQLKMLQWTVPTSDFPDTYMEELDGSFTRVAGGRFGSFSLSYPAYQQIAASNHSFDATFAFAANDEHVNVGLNGHASNADLVGVSGNFFSGMGMTPAAGRALSAADDATGAEPAVMISHRFWETQFAGSANAIGSTIYIDGHAAIVVGVTAPEFYGVQPGLAPDLWVPLHWYAEEMAKLNGETNPSAYIENKRAWWVGVIGRMKPGVSAAAASAELDVLFRQTLQTKASENQSGAAAEYGGGSPGAIAEEHEKPVVATPQLGTISLARGLDNLRREFSTSLWLLMGMVALVLVITCSNVAALLLTRATSRQKEVAVRVSLGAPKTRIMRQVLTESLLLAAAGGVAGMIVARWASSLLEALMSSGRFPINLSLAPDGRVLAFAIGVTLLSSLLFGVVPAWSAARVQPLTTLKQVSSTAGTSRFRSGKALVAVQIALSLVLMVSCGLLLRTLRRLETVSLGFEGHNLTRFTVSPGLNGYNNDQLMAYYQNLQRELAAVPGVQSVSYSLHPAIGAGASVTIGRIAGYTKPGKGVDIYRHDVGAGYFETMKIPVLLGRGITEHDGRTAPKVVVINEALAKKYFHGDNPLGHSLDLGSVKKPETYEIVGVSRDVKYSEIRNEVPPTAYFSYVQRKELPPFMTYEVRSTLAAPALTQTIDGVALRLDKSVAVVNVKTEAQAVREVLYLERTFAVLSSAFGGLALLLAAVGLYGTIAYTVAQRTNEIGIRMALGAERQTIVGMVMRELFEVVLTGMGIGLPAAWFGARLLQSQLFGLSPHDGVSLALAIVIVVLISALTGSLPARRAANVDPMTALRYE